MVKRKPGGAGGKARPRIEVVGYDDPATKWALQVVDGKIKTGIPTYHACKRHLADLEEKRFIWDPKMGDRFNDFCLKMCRVNQPTRGGKVPFKLLDWQAFCAYSMFSWRVRPNDKTSIYPGARRYRYGFVLTGKGSGKSPFGAAIGLYMMTADKFFPLDGPPVRENEPRCYVLASTIDQAEEVGIRHAADMVEGSPDLKRDMGMKPINAHPQSVISTVRNSFLRAVGVQSKLGGAAGLNPHYLQWEEMHEQRDREILNDYVAGFKDRLQPLLFMVTNAGKSKQTLGYDEYCKAKIAAQGREDFATYFSFISECDEADIGSKWYPLEKHWIKANPSLGQTIREDIIKDRIAHADTEPERQEVNRLYFSIWSEANDEFISQENWEAAEVEGFDAEGMKDGALNGSRVYIGIDTASKDDMCAIAYLHKCLDDKWRLRVRYWSPAGGFEDRAKICSGHLLDWRKDGWINTPGGNILDMRLFGQILKDEIAKWNCKHLVSDNYRFLELLLALKDIDQPYWIFEDEDRSTARKSTPGAVEIIQHPQIFMKKERKDGRDLWMDGSINAFKTLILGVNESGPTIEIERNPVLRWNRASAIVATDPQLNRRFNKKDTKTKMHGKIDGLVAATMAVGLGVLEEAKGIKMSPWENPNFEW